MQAVLHETQLEVARDTHRFKVLCAGRRWGKSVLAQLITLQWAVQKPGLYWIVSPSYKQSKQIHWRGLQQIIPRDWVVKTNQNELSITLKNGSIIELKGAENPDALRGVKLRGLVIDEIASIRNWDWLWSEVLRPTLTDYAAPALFISTPKGFNHFYELFTQGQDSASDQEHSDYKSWRFTSYENPYIPNAEIDKAKDELSENTFAQEYMADFRKYTGLVYKEFDRKIHVQELPDFQPVYYIRGLDRGFTNPTAVPIIEVNSDGDWYQTHELYSSSLTNVQLNEELTRLTQDVAIGSYELSTMDSAAAGDIQELNDLGQDFISVRKESGEAMVNYVSWKIQKFADRLRINATGKPRYYCHPRNVKTVYEFERYAWPDKVIDINQPEAPIKANDHMMDALADLNAMYMHAYEPAVRHPWDGKIPGTFVPPSLPDEDDNEWGTPMRDYGSDEF